MAPALSMRDVISPLGQFRPAFFQVSNGHMPDFQVAPLDLAPELAALFGRLIPAMLGIRFDDKWCYMYTIAMLIDGDHRKVAGHHMPFGLVNNILGHNTNTYLHRGSAGVVNSSHKGGKFTHMHRLTEEDLIHR